jgi:hypothetical protein
VEALETASLSVSEQAETINRQIARLAETVTYMSRGDYLIRGQGCESILQGLLKNGSVRRLPFQEMKEGSQVTLTSQEVGDAIESARNMSKWVRASPPEMITKTCDRVSPPSGFEILLDPTWC